MREAHSGIDVDTPHQRALAASALKTGSREDSLHCRRGMDERAKRIPKDPTTRVVQGDPCPQVPSVVRIRERELSPATPCGVAEEGLIERIAADDAMQRDRIGWFKIARDRREVATDELQAVRESLLLGAPPGGLQICRRGFDNGGAVHPGGQELEADHSHAAADVQQRIADYRCFPDSGQQQTRRRVGPFALVPSPVALRDSRTELTLSGRATRAGTAIHIL